MRTSPAHLSRSIYSAVSPKPSLSDEKTVNFLCPEIISMTMAHLKTTVLLLVQLVSCTVLGLSLERLPQRSDLRSVQMYDDEEDSYQHPEYDLMERVAKSNNVISFVDPFAPSAFLKNKDDQDGFWGNGQFRDHVKRGTESSKKSKQSEKELADILKDDESEKDKNKDPDSKNLEPSTNQKKKKKQKRESQDEKEKEEKQVNTEHDRDFHDWLRREYYRNMAKSFASMRRKRAMWGPPLEAEHPEAKEKKSMTPNARASASEHVRPKKTHEDDVDETRRFDEVTDNLKAIENVLLADALRTIRETSSNEEFSDFEDEDDGERQEEIRRRVSNDLNAAYDIETMRSALFRLQDTLFQMEKQQQQKRSRSPKFSLTYDKHKRGSECPPLNVLTSDCSALNDIVEDESLKYLLSHACNWHEVCYTCGEVFGLTSDNCDRGFIEQSRAICKDDASCESTSRLLLLPLRQRRVFYKRSNPSVCMVDQCVENFLVHG